ncbi:hypothetical protein Aperf_G00000116794 [Anoplocephala perfoliata]
MTSGPTLQLNSGYAIPQLGFGTFYAEKGLVAEAVKEAFDAGYRHIDTAMIYGNEEEVGQGISESMRKHGLNREDVFVTTKLWCNKHAPKDVRQACEESLKRLGLDYLDLYLVHFPAGFHIKEGAETSGTDPQRYIFEYHKLEDTWGAMEELVTAGLVKSIGVSNYSKRQIERILKNCKIVPAVNQVEVNLHWLNTKLIGYCKSKNIVVEGYGPLGNPGFFKDPSKSILELETVVEIAKNHNVSPAQVLIRHALQRKIVVLAKSVTAERIHSNFDVMGFELSGKEMYQLNKAGLDTRLFPATGLENHPQYPYHDEY